MALVANEDNLPKAECLGLMFVCVLLGFSISISSYLGCENRALAIFYFVLVLCLTKLYWISV
ncbi:hypothetical protein CGI83_14920 [Vibrio parahaemolyticus]|nr:hypothetical protein CGI83_14920 [Vibrio parahaemolyticus]